MTDVDRENRERARRLDALSEVVGRFAHDFSNLLATIVLNLNMIEKKCSDPTALSFAVSALRAADRGANLANRLLALAGKQRLARAPADIYLLVSQMRDRLSRVAGPTVELVMRSDEKVWPVSVDPDQIEFALVNLVENARDAMPSGGALTIEMANAEIAVPAPDLAPGDYVNISVADTGEGLSGEASERAFEPFFTTKRGSEHAGLGLGTVLGIAKAHGGNARIARAAGGGCRVEIYLPRATEADNLAVGDPVTALSRLNRSAKTTILVVDDDPDLLAVVQDGLNSLGCHVLLADGGGAALEIIASQSPIDLLMVDMNLAGMKGPHLIQRARDMRPGLRVLIMTGGHENLGTPATIAVLRKPFRSADLERAIVVALSDHVSR